MFGFFRRVNVMILDLFVCLVSVWNAFGRPILESSPEKTPYYSGSSANFRLQGFRPLQGTDLHGTNYLNLDWQLQQVYEFLVNDPPLWDDAREQSEVGNPMRSRANYVVWHGTMGQQHPTAIVIETAKYSITIDEFYGMTYQQAGFASPSDQYMKSCFTGTGNASSLTETLRIKAIMKSTATFASLHTIADSVDLTISHCLTGETSHFQFKQMIIPAVYMGSMEQVPHISYARGLHLYAHCQANCPYFETCHLEATTSILNVRMVQMEQYMVDTFSVTDCDNYIYWGEQMMRIFSAMFAQGILLAAHMSSLGEDVKEDCGWAAGLLPWIQKCNSSAAAVISRNLQCGSNDMMSHDDFVSVRLALESIYSCLGILCDDIGVGIKKNTGDFSFADRLCGGYVGSHPIASINQTKFYDSRMRDVRYTLFPSALNFTHALVNYEQPVLSSMADLGVAPGGTFTYDKFAEYHGMRDYAKQFVLGALVGTGPFENAGDAARIVAVEKGMVVLNMWLSATAMLEKTTSTCELAPWEQAMILYGDSHRDAVYRLANALCLEFNTCADDGTAATNIKIMNLFESEFSNLEQNDCTATPSIVSSIVSQMSVPLIQGALRAVHGVSRLQTHPYQPESSVFAATLLPMVDNCDADAAKTIAHNMAMTVEPESVDFLTVKQAFESVYECLGISCADIGGILEDTKDYYADAAPCFNAGTDNDEGHSGADANAAQTSHMSGHMLNILCLWFVFSVDWPRRTTSMEKK